MRHRRGSRQLCAYLSEYKAKVLMTQVVIEQVHEQIRKRPKWRFLVIELECIWQLPPSYDLVRVL